MDESRTPRLTYKVDLPGGQDRLKEAALHIMRRCEDAERFGLTKLNKILWRADFKAYAARRMPVTGRLYQRLQQGPAPVEMLPLLQEMQLAKLMRIEPVPVRNFTEHRPVALVEPSLRYFSPDDLVYLDAAVDYFWDYSGRAVSKESHGVAWETRSNGDPMPYDLALLSDERLTEAEATRFAHLGTKRGWQSQ